MAYIQEQKIALRKPYEITLTHARKPASDPWNYEAEQLRIIHDAGAAQKTRVSKRFSEERKSLHQKGAIMKERQVVLFSTIFYYYFCDQKYFLLGFAAFPGIGTRRFEKLVAAFGSAQQAWEGEDGNLIAILDSIIGKKFVTFRETFDLQQYADTLRKKKIHWFCPSDKDYPVLLHQLPHPIRPLALSGHVS